MSETPEVWVHFQGNIDQEDEAGAVLVTGEDPITIRIRFKKGDYRKIEGKVEIRVGAVIEWIHPPLTCQA